MVSDGLGSVLMAGLRELGNEDPGFIKLWDFLTKWTRVHLQRICRIWGLHDDAGRYSRWYLFAFIHVACFPSSFGWDYEYLWFFLFVVSFLWVVFFFLAFLFLYDSCFFWLRCLYFQFIWCSQRCHTVSRLSVHQNMEEQTASIVRDELTYISRNILHHGFCYSVTAFVNWSTELSGNYNIVKTAHYHIYQNQGGPTVLSSRTKNCFPVGHNGQKALLAH
jgi:hypothetical protein